MLSRFKDDLRKAGIIIESIIYLSKESRWKQEKQNSAYVIPTTFSFYNFARPSFYMVV